MSQNDYRILMTIYKYGCTNEMKSITLYKIHEISLLSVSKIRQSVKRFMQLEYISEGAVNHSAKTYFVTKSGIKKIKELMS